MYLIKFIIQALVFHGIPIATLRSSAFLRRSRFDKYFKEIAPPEQNHFLQKISLFAMFSGQAVTKLYC